MFYNIAIVDLLVGIMEHIIQVRRSLMRSFIGQRFSRTQHQFSKNVTRGNDRETYLLVMRCPKISSKFVKYLTYEVLNLWDHY